MSLMSNSFWQQFWEYACYRPYTHTRVNVWYIYISIFILCVLHINSLYIYIILYISHLYVLCECIRQGTIYRAWYPKAMHEVDVSSSYSLHRLDGMPKKIRSAEKYQVTIDERRLTISIIWVSANWNLSLHHIFGIIQEHPHSCIL